MMSHNNQEVFYGHHAEYYQNQESGLLIIELQPQKKIVVNIYSL